MSCAKTFFHYECEAVSEKDAMKYDDSGDPYHRLSCIFEGQCQNVENSSLFSYDKEMYKKVIQT